MTAPIISSVYQMDFAALFRDRWAGRLANQGDVRDVGGFAIDVSGQVSRGQETTRSAFTPGSGSTVYDPSTPPHAPQAVGGGLSTSNLLILQGIPTDQLQASMAAPAAASVIGANPYAVAIPASVDVVHREDAPIQQVTTVGYFPGDAPDKGTQRDLTIAQVERLRALADIERDLSAEFGQPVKLAWDGGAGEYLMLRKGDAGYDDFRSVADLVRTLPHDLKRMSLFTADEIDRLTA